MSFEVSKLIDAAISTGEQILPFRSPSITALGIIFYILFTQPDNFAFFEDQTINHHSSIEDYANHCTQMGTFYVIQLDRSKLEENVIEKKRFEDFVTVGEKVPYIALIRELWVTTLLFGAILMQILGSILLSCSKVTLGKIKKTKTKKAILRTLGFRSKRYARFSDNIVKDFDIIPAKLIALLWCYFSLKIILFPNDNAYKVILPYIKIPSDLLCTIPVIISDSKADSAIGNNFAEESPEGLEDNVIGNDKAHTYINLLAVNPSAPIQTLTLELYFLVIFMSFIGELALCYSGSVSMKLSAE
ncbi:MAG: hypothetical protein MHPSP_001546 [Paramarteilia canceri]